MKINKIINTRLEFIESNCDCFLATAMFKYISKVDKKLKDNIGFDENNETQNNDFLYCYSADDLEMKSKIEKHIVEFEKKFNLIKDFLEERVENDEISDSDEFYEQFKELSNIVTLNGKLNNTLDNKEKVKTKVKKKL